MKKNVFIPIFIILFFIACNTDKKEVEKIIEKEPIIKEVELSADLSELTNNQKQMIKIFIKASKYIDSIFFYENLGNYKQILSSIEDTVLRKKFINNFGPWDRFKDNKPFIEGVGKKPLGANFYPKDMSKMEFHEFEQECKESHYTFIRRDSAGNLMCIPYNYIFKEQIDSISKLLNNAADLAENLNFSYYLNQRALGLQTDSYYKSDSIWVNLKNNKLDFVIGPIYVLEDKLLNLKAEHQSYVLVKETEWTQKMKKYNKWLKFLQKAIPVPEKYRAEEPGENSSIVIYNAIYYGGSGKSGGTMISIMYPLEPEIQMEQGVKNVQFKNIIEYKFKAVTEPISKVILKKNQKKHVSEDAFFMNTILYEMANSLGIRNTINDKGTVRNALKDYYTISDYIKNYSLILFLAEKLYEVGEIEHDLKENYFTFVVNLVRLIRFGYENDYAVANLVCYNYLVENKAIKYNNNGYIIIDYDKMKKNIEKLIKKIIIMQGNGDYNGLKEFISNHKNFDQNLIKIINKLNKNEIPTDMYMIQGEDILEI